MRHRLAVLALWAVATVSATLLVSAGVGVVRTAARTQTALVTPILQITVQAAPSSDESVTPAQPSIVSAEPVSAAPAPDPTAPPVESVATSDLGEQVLLEAAPAIAPSTGATRMPSPGTGVITSTSGTTRPATRPVPPPPAPAPTVTVASTAAPTTAAATAPDRGGAIETFVALEAGVVHVGIDGQRLRVHDTASNPGWRAQVDQASGDEIRVTFRNGVDRVRFVAELDDGEIDTEVTRERENPRAAATTTTTTTEAPRPTGRPSTTAPPATAAPPATTTTERPSPPSTPSTHAVRTEGGEVTVTIDDDDIRLDVDDR